MVTGDDNMFIWRRCLWWAHGCSLDAVGVLVAYAWGLARLSGARPPWYVFLLLGLGIWLGYVADRLVDVGRDPSRARQSGRHAFHLRHRDRLRLLWWVVCLAMMVTGILDLPIGAFEGGGLVALAAAAYVLWNGKRRRRNYRPTRSAFKKRLGTVSLLTLAGAWWWPWWPGTNRTALVAGMGIFAVAAAWQIYLLHHRRREPIPWRWGWKCAEGASAAALLGLAWLAGGGWALPGAALLAGSLLYLGGTAETGDTSLRALGADAALAIGWVLLGVLGAG